MHDDAGVKAVGVVEGITGAVDDDDDVPDDVSNIPPGALGWGCAVDALEVVCDTLVVVDGCS